MTTKKKISFSIGITLILGVLVIYFVILPTAGDIKKIHQSVYLERVDLEKKYQRGMLLKQAIKNFQQVKPLEEKFNAIFILKDKELDFITTIEKIAANNSLEQDIKLQPVPVKINSDSEYLTSNLTVTLKGGFLDTLIYLRNLELLNYQVNIKSLTIEADPNNKNIITQLSSEVYTRQNQN